MEKCWSKRMKENEEENRPRSEIIREVKRWYDIHYMATDYNKRLVATYNETKRLDSPILLSSIRQQGVFKDLFLSQTFVFGKNQIILGFNLIDQEANFVIRTHDKEVVLDYAAWHDLREHQKTNTVAQFLKKKKLRLNAVSLQHFNELVNDTAHLMEFYSENHDEVALYYNRYEELSDEGKPVKYFKPEDVPDWYLQEDDQEETIDYVRLFHEIGIMCKHYLWCRQAIIRMILKEEEE